MHKKITTDQRQFFTNLSNNNTGQFKINWEQFKYRGMKENQLELEGLPKRKKIMSRGSPLKLTWTSLDHSTGNAICKPSNSHTIQFNKFTINITLKSYDKKNQEIFVK